MTIHEFTVSSGNEEITVSRCFCAFDTSFIPYREFHFAAGGMRRNRSLFSSYFYAVR